MPSQLYFNLFKIWSKMHLIGPSFQTVCPILGKFSWTSVRHFCSLNKLKLCWRFSCFKDAMLVPFIWSCFCLFAHDYYCVLFIYFSSIFTHCCFDNAKKIKKLVPLFLFFKIIFGDMLVCGLWMWNDWHLLYGCFGWYCDFHSPLKQKLKRDLCFLFTIVHNAWWQK